MSDPAAQSTAQFNVRLADGRAFGPADMGLITVWAREGRVPADAWIEREGAPPVRAGEHPALRALYQAPPTMAGPVSPAGGAGGMDSALTTLIPYRNGLALGSYYTGVFALIPIIGLVLGPVAIILGILGLRYASSHANAKGRVHAWVGIVLGTLVLAGHLALIWAMVTGKLR